MIKYVIWILMIFINSLEIVNAQEPGGKQNHWKLGGAVGMDFAQMLFVNPKFGAGEDKIGIGGNLSFFAKYKQNRLSWDNFLGLTFGVQRLGSFRRQIPFQKSVDELRLTSKFGYSITDQSPFGYAFDVLFLSQITPTFEGNILSPNSDSVTLPIAQFCSPATLTLSPGIGFKKKTNLGEFHALLSPASLKLIFVASDTTARLGLHGNPYSTGVTEQEFIDTWGVRPDGQFGTNIFYAKNSIQFGATLKAGYSHKFFKYKEGEKDKFRLVLATTLNLYSNYMRMPQHIDVEWITNVDLMLFKGLSISLMTNLFWDYDVLVQVDEDGDITTGVNGYESQGRRVSFMQSLLIKYNFLF
ncbi:MAG: DUF3078 domain-containing protein [Saprospiraceae bacterium]|nr:DUF3078 domain-containing protein [Saprospiraceae bacterium]